MNPLPVAGATTMPNCPLKLQGLFGNPEFFKQQMGNPKFINEIYQRQPALLACDGDKCGFFTVVEANDEKAPPVKGCSISLTTQAINALMFSVDDVTDALSEAQESVEEAKNLLGGAAVVAAQKFGIDVGEIQKLMQASQESSEAEEGSDEDEDDDDDDDDDLDDDDLGDDSEDDSSDEDGDGDSDDAGDE